jgi:hypothetical protein
MEAIRSPKLYLFSTYRKWLIVCNSLQHTFQASQSAVSSPVDVPLLPASRPRRLATISPQLPILLYSQSESESESHFTTDGQSPSLSWHKAPIWGFRPDIYYCLTVTVLFLFCGRPLWREDGSVFVHAASPYQRSLSRVRDPWYSRPYITVSNLRLPFSSPPTTRRVTVEVFEPASTRAFCALKTPSRYVVSTRTAQKILLLIITIVLWDREPLPSNSCFSGFTVLALSKYATIYTHNRVCVYIYTYI